MQLFDFRNQRVLVVGGSSGIGLAAAKLAASAGASVTLASRSTKKLQAAQLQMEQPVDVQSVDLTSDSSVEEFFKQSDSWNHVIVTGSDVSIAAVRELPIDVARAAFDSKFWGFYRVARAANIRPDGSLSVVAGFLATRPVAGRALMGSINGALECLVRGLALELKPVRVNAVSPAMIATEMWNTVEAKDRAAMFERVGSSYPAGRIGDPEEIAKQLLLLAATGYATGTVVTLDGGASLA